MCSIKTWKYSSMTLSSVWFSFYRDHWLHFDEKTFDYIIAIFLSCYFLFCWRSICFLAMGIPEAIIWIRRSKTTCIASLSLSLSLLSFTYTYTESFFYVVIYFVLYYFCYYTVFSHNGVVKQYNKTCFIVILPTSMKIYWHFDCLQHFVQNILWQILSWISKSKSKTILLLRYPYKQTWN